MCGLSRLLTFYRMIYYACMRINSHHIYCSIWSYLFPKFLFSLIVGACNFLPKTFTNGNGNSLSLQAESAYIYTQLCRYLSN